MIDAIVPPSNLGRVTNELADLPVDISWWMLEVVFISVGLSHNVKEERGKK